MTPTRADFEVYLRSRAIPRSEAERMTCQVPGCAHQHELGPLVLNQACHSGATQLATYWMGSVIITCSVCAKLVARFEVM